MSDKKEGQKKAPKVEELQEKLQNRKELFFRLSEDLFATNQDFMTKKEELKQLKKLNAGTTQQFVDLITNYALKEAELLEQREGTSTTSNIVHEYASESNKDVEYCRSELKDSLKQYQEARRNLKKSQNEFGRLEDTSRMESLNFLAFCRYSQSVQSNDMNKVIVGDNLPTKREISLCKSSYQQYIDRSSQKLCGFYTDKIREFQRDERLVMGRSKALMESQRLAGNNFANHNVYATNTTAFTESHEKEGIPASAVSHANSIENKVAQKLIAEVQSQYSIEDSHHRSAGAATTTEAVGIGSGVGGIGAASNSQNTLAQKSRSSSGSDLERNVGLEDDEAHHDEMLLQRILASSEVYPPLAPGKMTQTLPELGADAHGNLSSSIVAAGAGAATLSIFDGREKKKKLTKQEMKLNRLMAATSARAAATTGGADADASTGGTMMMNTAGARAGHGGASRAVQVNHQLSELYGSRRKATAAVHQLQNPKLLFNALDYLKAADPDNVPVRILQENDSNALGSGDHHPEENYDSNNTGGDIEAPLTHLLTQLSKAEGKFRELNAIKEGLDIQLVKQIHFLLILARDLQADTGCRAPGALVASGQLKPVAVSESKLREAFVRPKEGNRHRYAGTPGDSNAATMGAISSKYRFRIDPSGESAAPLVPLRDVMQQYLESEESIGTHIQELKKVLNIKSNESHSQ